MWDNETKACKSRCAENEMWDNETKACKSRCAENEMWDKSVKTCKTQYIPCRYIKVLSTQPNNILNFIELEAYDQNGVNVALRKSATQSALEPAEKNVPATNGVDGNRYTYIHTKYTDKDAWWEVDLGTMHKIIKIKLVRRVTMPWALREDGARIQCLDENKSVIKEVIVSKYNNTKQKPLEEEFTFNEIVKETFANIRPIYNKRYSFLNN
jgi:hypothetical protein